MVEIKLIGDSKDPDHQREFEAAQQLKDILQAGLRKDDAGIILILFNLKVYGYKCKDIDLLVFADFDTPLQRSIKCRTRGSQPDHTLRYRDVLIKSFCTIIEVKSHDATGIRFQGSQAEVLYDGEWSNVSNQSDEQNLALRFFLEDTINWTPSPYLVNLIWFTELERESLREHKHNYLPNRFSFLELMTLVCRQALPLGLSSTKCIMKCTAVETDQAEVNLQKAMSHFTTVRRTIGNLTRSKLEEITKRLLNQQAYAQSLGNRLVVVRGRPGTGKTIKLLHMAHDLVVERGFKCLLLTYNLALVSDMRRLVALANIDRGIPTARLHIQTIHSFVIGLMDYLGVPEVNRASFNEKYEARRALFAEYLREGVLTRQDLSARESKAQPFLWDFYFVDEGQDWPEEEKFILFSLFESKQFVVADGVDQLVRSQQPIDWTCSVEHHRPIISEKRSLRQKANLVRFEALLAEELGLFWDLQASRDAAGGRVVVIEGEYSRGLHEELFTHCIANENNAYEMMFLVPPSLVESRADNERYFKLSALWEREWGIKLWDGTDPKKRSEYPSLPEEHRVFQYDSSRGLEGWTVVCLWLDCLFEYKRQTFRPDQQGPQLALRTHEEQRSEFASRWLMVPLTRAVDSLVITLRSGESELAKHLKVVASACPDIVDWRKQL